MNHFRINVKKILDSRCLIFELHISVCATFLILFQLTGVFYLVDFRATRDQAKCLNDIPVPERHYDFLREGNAPGDQFKAIDQCHQSFGPKFVPHVKENEPPFEVVPHKNSAIISKSCIYNLILI